MRVRAVYDQTFREEAVALLKRTDRTLPQVAHDLGVVPQTLRYWYNGAMAKKKSKKPGPELMAKPSDGAGEETVKAKVARLERENAHLRKEIEDLKMDRAILKKAAAFFAKESE